MNEVLAGRIEVSAAQAIGDIGGRERRRFVFSDLEHLDPEKRWSLEKVGQHFRQNILFKQDVLVENIV